MTLEQSRGALLLADMGLPTDFRWPTGFVWGAATAPFQADLLTADDFMTSLAGDAPRTTLGTFHLGLDLRLGNRTGFSMFLETIPDRNQSDNFGSYAKVLGLGFQTLGTEVTFCT